MVQLACIDTYPEALKKAVLSNPTFVAAYAATFDTMMSFEENVGRFDDYLQKQSKENVIRTAEHLITAAGNCWFEGFHITRILDPHEIYDHGIQILEWETYRDRIDRVLSSITDLNYVERQCALAPVLEYFKEEGIGRLGHLSFFSPASDYALYENSNGGLTQLYGKNIGGEILEHFSVGCSGNEFLYKKLCGIGNKYLVRFQFHLQDLFRGLCEFSFDLFMNAIAFAVLYCRDHSQLPHDCIFISHLQKPVPPKDIISMALLRAETEESY